MLLQWWKFLELLLLPHGFQFRFVAGCPFDGLLSGSVGQIALRHFKSLQIGQSDWFIVHGMEMRRRAIPEKHVDEKP